MMIQINACREGLDYTVGMEYTIDKNIELFEGLNKQEINALKAISQERSYQKKNVLFFEGDRPGKLHLLLDGIVKVYKVDAKGNEVILNFFRPQSLIAESAHMQKIPFPASAVCETECQLLEIDYAMFEKEFLRNPDISIKIINSLNKKVKNLQKVISTNLTKGTLERISSFLYENRPHIGEISHRKIAAVLNITPETLSRHLAGLKQDGVIRVERRKIIILEAKRLLDYC